jgi:dolichyl-diphosphooligosaccharide--protein glycosyltransferase
MSKVPKRGKLRNPPKGRRYASYAIVAVLIVLVGSGLYLYGPRILGGASSTSTSTTFANPSCTPSTSTSTGGANGTYAIICTNLGLIEVQLFPADAPQTVANFVKLANSGFYNDLVWHRIVPGFVIQAGDPNTKNGGGNRSTWGQGTSGTNLPFETNSLSEANGTIAMASTGSKVGGSSQFFINLVDNSANLDGNYVVFGQVINGMSVVNALAKVATDTTSGSPDFQQPLNPSQAYIVSVTIQNTP